MRMLFQWSKPMVWAAKCCTCGDKCSPRPDMRSKVTAVINSCALRVASWVAHSVHVARICGWMWTFLLGRANANRLLMQWDGQTHNGSIWALLLWRGGNDGALVLLHCFDTKLVQFGSAKHLRNIKDKPLCVVMATVLWDLLLLPQLISFVLLRSSFFYYSYFVFFISRVL